MANAILGHGQLSLAKYLLIVAAEDNPELDIQHVPDFLRHVLERVDWRHDLHFQTQTNIDTLDYSGTALNEGSKVVIVAAGPPRRTLPVAADSRLRVPEDRGFKRPRVFLPGILVVQGPPCRGKRRGRIPPSPSSARAYNRADAINNFPLVVVVDEVDIRLADLGQFPLDHLHAEQSGGRRVRHRIVHCGQALGLPRLAGDRRPDQAPACPAAGRGSRR